MTRSEFSEAPLEVFWGSGSQPSWRVLLALEVKGVPYESRLISFADGEHRSPKFLALNPRHKVPAIRQGDYTLYESRAILAYLEHAHPAVPLFGRDPRESGLVERFVDEFVHYYEPPLMEYVRSLFFGRHEERRAAIEAAIPAIIEETEVFGSHLAHASAGSGWLVGGTVSAADLFYYPTLKSLFRALEKPGAEQFALTHAEINRRAPHLEQWMQAVESLPGYERTYPPHWK